MSKRRHNSDDDDYDMIGLDDDEDSDSDDFIEIQLHSNSIEVRYSQLFKYSYVIKQYGLEGARSFLPQDLNDYIYNNDISERNVLIFFKVIEDEKQVKIDTQSFYDLSLLSQHYKVKKLEKNLKKYVEKHSNDVNFIINTIIKKGSKNLPSTFRDSFNDNDFTHQYEEILKQKVDDCLKCEDFEQLDTSSIHRIIEGSEGKFSSDALYEFIIKSIKDRYPLFEFLNIYSLSDENFNALFDLYNDNKSNPETNYYFYHLQVDLKSIREFRQNKQEHDSQMENLIEENKQLREDNERFRFEKNKLNSKLKLLLSSNNELKSDNEQAKNVDKKQLDSISEENEHLKEENLFLKNQIEDKEKQIKKLSKNHHEKSNDNI